LKLPRAFELSRSKSDVRTEADEVGRQAEMRSSDEAAKLPSNLSGRAKNSLFDQVKTASCASHADGMEPPVLHGRTAAIALEVVTHVSLIELSMMI
jgi:hypothetical protein